ncbi:hypothetical protein PCH_Pc12g01920 [Penicillium rubens Wisconsin 54-1255]|uniref:Uncharacterized protein n=1 Tax=Penicillium rubens (strain ATCC 28089 / DSM 1075 / NRRL 1951 / Wisconsin 54-1255) TaxID=500485 RepID=B6GZD5_PENRW|nr:hypothetical protein PCH_Pc12g01920 [Penicillium rubens Wisconsin 54-1255]
MDLKQLILGEKVKIQHSAVPQHRIVSPETDDNSEINMVTPSYPGLTTMEIAVRGSYQKKPRFLGGMHFDHDIAVTSIQVIITLHRRLNIAIEPAFSHVFAHSYVVVTESMLFTLTESF